MNEAIGIGFFQFDNLMQSRVPVAIFAPILPFEEILSGASLAHLNQNLVRLDDAVSVGSIQLYFETKKLPLHFPFVCLCQNGEQSKAWAQELVKNGWQNSYYVEGGFSALVQELKESRLA